MANKGLAITKEVRFRCANCKKLLPKGIEEDEKAKKLHLKECKDDFEVGSVDRPTAEEIAIEKNPKLKAEYKETEKLMKKAGK